MVTGCHSSCPSESSSEEEDDDDDEGEESIAFNSRSSRFCCSAAAAAAACRAAYEAGILEPYEGCGGCCRVEEEEDGEFPPAAAPREDKGDTGFWPAPREEDGISPKTSTSVRSATRSGGASRFEFGDEAAGGTRADFGEDDDDDGFCFFSALALTLAEAVAEAAALTGEKVAGWCAGDEADKGLSNDARLPAETGLGGVCGRAFSFCSSMPFSG